MPFLVVCGMSHNSSRFESYGPTKLKDPHMMASSPPTDVAAKKLCNDNSRVVNAILSGLSINVFVKVMHCKSAKELWDKLKVIYEGDSKVKQAKLQTLRAQFENLKMKEEENIAEYLQRVDEIVNSVRALGETVEDKYIVQKVLRSFPMRYDAKISTLEDRDNLDKLTMDELHGILIAYEMRTRKERPSKGEMTFKERKSKKNQEQVSNEDQSEISDEEVENFMKKLKKGTGKFKGKLPLKCFNCGKVGHFPTNVPIQNKKKVMVKKLTKSTRREKWKQEEIPQKEEDLLHQRRKQLI
jgi:hypothetical protein